MIYFKTFLALITSFLLSGCYSMTHVPSSKYNDIKSSHNRIEITLADQEKIFIEKTDSLEINDSMKLVHIVKDSVIMNFNLDNISEIREEKFDLVKTSFATLWISVLSFFAIGFVLLAVSDGGFAKN
jgi:hypothetical protein